MTDANGGVPPLMPEIRAEAVRWFKQAYRAGIRVEIVRNAAQIIMERLNTVIKGNPAYIHNRPRGKGYERLELQRKFLRAILEIKCRMFTSLQLQPVSMLIHWLCRGLPLPPQLTHSRIR